MATSFASSLDELAEWRAALGQRLDEYSRFLSGYDVADESARESLDNLRRRLVGEKLVVAFVAEFSRGKSELINAIFFSDTGRRILPATPGRTTMCPVELGYEPEEAPALALLPIATRLEGLSLAELRGQMQAWTHVTLDVTSAERLSEALLEVTRTQWVSVNDARALGFWDDDDTEDNPPVDDEGRVEVPAWRHALINYPHPLLKRGLVVLDTPGLNAIGAEPELTLGLLPSAHAAVFILGADTGVTKSDMTIWRDHLGSPASTAFVVLNKIDALADPLATVEQVREQIEQQQIATARTLGSPIERVFPISARQALAARIDGDAQMLLESRLPELEAALGAQLLPQRREALEEAVLETAQRMESQVSRHVGDRRRQLAEQMLELRGLRGKSGAKTRLMLERVDAETAEFEQCITRLQAVRMVHNRMLKNALVDLSSDRLREEVTEMQAAMNALLLNLGAKKAFVALCSRLREVLEATQVRTNEIHDMLGASFGMLNAEFGFGLAVSTPLELERFKLDLMLIQRNYVQYLGLTQALRLSQPKFMEQFRRMLVSKLRVVFENTSGEVELWNKMASAQVDSQLRERRRGFRRRREALERIQVAAGDLEQRINELEAQDSQLQQLQSRNAELARKLKEHAQSSPYADQPVPNEPVLQFAAQA
ncbi:MAG TPA: dynamin family protein [Rhizobacter sp.]|nr:dynamin family protein [Rhizobacter sp.]